MADITYCSSTDCPSKECKIKVFNNNNTFKAGDLISIADFSGTCRFYIGWMVNEIENRDHDIQDLISHVGYDEAQCGYDK